MRALIVDDESRVRKAVRLLVDWERHGIDEVLEAGGGNEAVEMIQKYKPALVIMDMMMEAGHGMELMSWVNTHAGSVKFIVISGHDDFEFVRSAVRHGGIDYILKPIDPEAINAAVEKAILGWRREERERLEQQQQSIRLNEIKPVYSEKLLSSLIDDPGSAESTLKRLRLEKVVPEDKETARLLLIQIDPGDKALFGRFGNDSELLSFAFINICNEFLLPERLGIAFKHWGMPLEVPILLWDRLEQAPELIARINEGLYDTFQRRVHVGVAATGPLPHSLPAQYAEALGAVRRRNLLEPDQYIHFLQRPAWEPGEARDTGEGGGVSGGVSLFASVREEWKTAVLSGDAGQIDAAAHHGVETLCRAGIVTPEMLEAWKNDVLSFRLGLLRETLGQEAEGALSSLEQSDAEQAPPLINAYAFSAFAWQDWSSSFMDRIALEISEHKPREKHTIRDIITYIEQHYGSEISLQDIASHFYVSREYISRKFKQEFGINFSDYLAEYRIDKAKRLMLNPSLKMQQIAEMVGIHDVKYFSKVFKKQTGESPRDYRSKLKL